MLSDDVGQEFRCDTTGIIAYLCSTISGFQLELPAARAWNHLEMTSFKGLVIDVGSKL